MSKERQKKDIITQELRALEAIVVRKDLPSRDKLKLIKRYERVLSQQSGITLRVLEEITHVMNRKGLTGAQHIDELRELERTFIEGARKSMTEGGMKVGPPEVKELREVFVKVVATKTRLKDLSGVIMKLRLKRATALRMQRAKIERPKRKSGAKAPRKQRPR